MPYTGMPPTKVRLALVTIIAHDQLMIHKLIYSVYLLANPAVLLYNVSANKRGREQWNMILVFKLKFTCIL